MADNLEVWMAAEVEYVVLVAGEVVVEAEHLVASLDQIGAQMAAQETRSTRYCAISSPAQLPQRCRARRPNADLNQRHHQHTHQVSASLLFAASSLLAGRPLAPPHGSPLRH